ncbi:MAG: sirohydrochlorin cobaltochelatase [Clostridiales bacterium]|nr:sirohydrochlorin cobaltochelatase [Clostridiales bacterium]
MNSLIEAIQVQERYDDTDLYCELAKACWDALPEADQQEDDGYFSEDTGNASADDPLNTAPDKTKELLVVSFGTSFNDSRVATIGAVEKALAAAYGDEYAVRRAFTAQIIINHIQSRDGEKIDNVKQAMDKAVAAGVEEMIVQPTHLMSGAEYDELKGEIDKYADKIDITYAKPLLDSDADKQAVAQAVVAAAVEDADYASLEAAAADGVAFVFMGHGTSHEANVTYTQMQQTMDGLNYANCFIGTVEGIPAATALPEVKKALEAKGYTKVVLRPLMVVAGDHANNDMAADEEGSWYYAFVHGGEFEVEGHDEPVDIGDGFGAANVTCQINGLGEIAAIQQLYVAHVAEVLS